MRWKTALPSLSLRLRKTLLNPRVIRRLRQNPSPPVRALGEALHAHRIGEITPEERHWIEAIEGIRAAMCASADRITGPDYGAGLPLEAEPAEGKTVTETVCDACRNYSKPPGWSQLLFHLVRKFRPVTCVELGTCLGVSAAYQAAALEVNADGNLITLEGSPAFAAIASGNLQNLGLAHRAKVVVGRFQDSLGTVLGGAGKVDYVFIDGHHDEHATLRYFEQLLPCLSPSAVLVFDDIAWSPGMRRAWERIRNDPRLDVSVGCSMLGICLVGAGAKARYDISMN